MNLISPWITTHGMLRTRDRAVDRHQKSTKAKKRRKSTRVLEFSSCNIMSLYNKLYRLNCFFLYVIIKQGAQDMQRKRRIVLKLLGRRSDLYLSYIMFTCWAFFGKELASSGGRNQAYCSAESARIGVLLFTFWLDVCLLSIYLLSLKIPRGFRGARIYVFVWAGR